MRDVNLKLPVLCLHAFPFDRRPSSSGVQVNVAGPDSGYAAWSQTGPATRIPLSGCSGLRRRPAGDAPSYSHPLTGAEMGNPWSGGRLDEVWGLPVLEPAHF